MRPLSLSQTSIQPRTSLSKFAEASMRYPPPVIKAALATFTCLPFYPNQCCYRAETSAREPCRPANLSGPVLFCIDTSDSESRRIFQDFSRSTRLSHLCTAPMLIFALFCKFSFNFPDFCKIFRIFQQIEHFSPQISRNFAGISGNCRELPELREFCRKILKILIIFRTFTEILPEWVSAREPRCRLDSSTDREFKDSRA